MSVILYFGMMFCLLAFGIGILSLTFRQWYLDSQKKKSEGAGPSDLA